MENNVFIQSGKAEQFDFQLAVNGLSGQDVHVRFVLHSDPFHMMFPCVQSNGDNWSLQLPSMPWLEPSTYNFVIEVIADGYYFPAHEGTLTVSKSPEVYIKKSDATMKVRKGTSSTPLSILNQPNEEKADEPIASPEPAPVDKAKADNFKEIIDRLKKPVADPDTTEKEEKVVKAAEKVEDKKDDKKKSDDKTEDKKDDKKKDEVKESDPLAKAREIADKVLTEDKKPAPKKPTAAKKDKALDIINEHKKEQAAKKKREEQRQRRLNEQANAKSAEKNQAKTAPVVEEAPVVVKDTAKDLAAKAILESVKKEDNTQPKNPIFKKGNTVTK